MDLGRVVWRLLLPKPSSGSGTSEEMLEPYVPSMHSTQPAPVHAFFEYNQAGRGILDVSGAGPDSHCQGHRRMRRVSCTSTRHSSLGLCENNDLALRPPSQPDNQGRVSKARSNRDQKGRGPKGYRAEQAWQVLGGTQKPGRWQQGLQDILRPWRRSILPMARSGGLPGGQRHQHQNQSSSSTGLASDQETHGGRHAATSIVES